jgi:retron-type reverse transcriptase
MRLIGLLQTADSYLDALEHLEQTHNKPHQQRKIVYGNLAIQDIFMHKQSFAKTIATSIKQQDYHYHPLKKSTIKQKNKIRTIYPHFISDYIVQSVIYKYLSQIIEPHLSDSLMSYRKGRSTKDAIYRVRDYIQKHTHNNKVDLYVVQTDLQNYTDTIPIATNQPFWTIAQDLKEDNYSWQLFCQALQATYEENDLLYCKLFGTPMGSPIGSLIANLYLNDLDHKIARSKKSLYLRFGDDLLFCDTDPEAVLRAMSIIKQETSALGLIINPEKTHYTYLTRAGRPSPHSSFKGSSVITYLGQKVHGNASISLTAERENAILKLVRKKLNNSYLLLQDKPLVEQGQAVCKMLNKTFLNECAVDTSRFLQQIKSINHRGLLKRLDYNIALEVAKHLTHSKSVKAFRQIPYKTIRREYGLISLCQLKNKMDQDGKHTSTTQ